MRADGPDAVDDGPPVEVQSPRPVVCRAAAPVGCVLLATVSLALPSSIAFDPWAWLTWGRELTRWDLDTVAGPSWKPLPVLVTTALAPLDDLAPEAWLVLTRSLGLFGLVLAFRLATRYAGRVAGAVAVAALVLSPDGGPRLVRLVMEGHSAPLEATLGLWAVERHLAARPGQALLALTALGLLRPEAWPLLLAYALWRWRSAPGGRTAVVVALASIPVFWFGGDWLGSGDPWHGAEAAQVASGSAWSRFTLALDHVAKVVIAPAWVAAAIAVVGAWRRREWVLLTLAAGAGVWIAVVTAMTTALGYAALSRFLLPAAAALCVLAGIGTVWGGLALATRGRRAVVVGGAVAVVVTVVFAWPRVTNLGEQWDGIQDRARIEDDLVAAVDEAGRATLQACGAVAADPSTLPQAALAWALDLPLGRVERTPADGPHVAFLNSHVSGEGPEANGPVLARSGSWTVVPVDCAVDNAIRSRDG